jgi:hypothetical protein
MLGQRAKQRRVTSLTLMQRRPLAALALIEWTRASLGLDQIGRSEVMLIAIPMPDHATRVLAGVYDPRGLRRNEPLDPAFAINPHQLTRIWASKGRVRSCAAANENALRGDRKRLPNELWLNRHGGGLLTPMRQNPRRSVLSQTGLRLTRFCLTWFCLTLLHLGEQAFNGHGFKLALSGRRPRPTPPAPERLEGLSKRRSPAGDHAEAVQWRSGIPIRRAHSAKLAQIQVWLLHQNPNKTAKDIHLLDCW